MHKQISNKLIEELAERNNRKILLIVLDGLGDIGIPELDNRTPLEAAATPNMDRLAESGALGVHIPIAPGITPGSGPAHLALFGYDPVRFRIGRGVLAALGIGFPLQKGDMSARINFCTVDEKGKVTDRRAGRISTELNEKLVEKLQSISISGVDLYVRTVKQHRACVIFRGEGLSEELTDTDPGKIDRLPFPVKAQTDRAFRSAEIVSTFIKSAREILKYDNPANMVLLRGFSIYKPPLSLLERFRLNAAAIALYPMYKGVASLVGMEVLKPEKENLEGQVTAAKKAADDGFDFVFLHHKSADSAGEDGNWKAKITAIEEFDKIVPQVEKIGYDVITITGDHSTPCTMKLHSWHSVPVLIQGRDLRTGYSASFSEREAILTGSLGTLNALDLLPLMMAAAGKLGKFGA